MTLADPRTHTDRLADQIADAIIDGSFEPGARLDEASLAERFGVSRTPVREALRQLTATGLIIVRPRRGALVATATNEQLSALFVAMGEVEATCARLCAISMTPLERRTLGALLDRMGFLARRSDRIGYLDANHEFHTRIYDGAHNSVLQEFANGLRRRLAPFRSAQFRAAGRLKKSHEEHAVVVAAILRGDAAAAHAAMLHHVNLVEIAVDEMATAKRKVASRRPAPGVARPQ